MTTCKKCLVSGRVQGVFYRDTTRRKAEQLQLTGYAKNLSDGRVEVVACGTDESVNELCEWLWKGSDYSSVSDVQCQEIEIDEHEKSNRFATM